MGLDMYLSAKKYTSKYNEVELNRKLWKVIGKKPCDNINSAEVKFGCGYWRKANHIHSWFVENIQDGEDNCQETYVSRKQLIELRNICEEVIELLRLKKNFNVDKLEKLLPTRKGFFFGSYEYEEEYKIEVERTIQIINNCLETYDESWRFYYQASW